MAKLTPKQAAFVREYLVDLNATQAATRAGYSAKTARSQAARLLTDVDVSEAVQAGMDERANRVQVKSDDVLRELMRIGLSDIREAYQDDGKLKPIKDMPEGIARAIAGVETEELWDGFGEDRERTGDVVKVKFWNKPQALELLGKHLKLFTDKTELTGKDDGPVQVSIAINRKVAK